MKLAIRILLFILLLIAGVKVIEYQYEPLDKGFLSEFEYVPLTLTILLTLTIFSLDFFAYKKTKTPHNFISSLMGVGIILFTTIKIFQRIEIDNSKTVMTLWTLPNSKNNCYLEFKVNNKIRMTEYHHFGETIYYGAYLKQNDTIKIIDFTKNKFLEVNPDIGILRNDSCFWTNNFDTMILKH